MDALPQELVHRVSSFLDLADLKNTLLVSRKFQFAAEEYSEVFSHYALTLENASTFISRYSGHRSCYLQEVSFSTSILPRDDDAEENCRDTADELKAMDEDFTRQIQFLFETLKSFEERLGGEAPRRIRLTIFEPTREKNDEDWYCLHHKFASWRIHLLLPSTLPTIDCVQTLTIKTPDRQFACDGPFVALRNLDLRIILDIAKRCPKLELLSCKIGGHEWRKDYQSEAIKAIAQEWDGPRRDSRHDFGKGAEGVKNALPLLRHIHLDFLYPYNQVEYIDQREALPNLVFPSAYDPLSSSLRLFSYQLRTMILHLVADDTLFWPRNGAHPFWPMLETISVRFHISTPSGSWYFQGLPGVGATHGYKLDPDRLYPPFSGTAQDVENDDLADDEGWTRWEDLNIVRFRSDPNEETLIPFIAAFAKATACMPALKEFALWSSLNIQSLHYSPLDVSSAYENFDTTQITRFEDEDLAWGIAYTKPGEKAFWKHPGSDYSHSRQMWWRVANWRPNPEVHNLFREIGRNTYGEDLLEYWDDDFAGQRLCRQDNFQSWEWERCLLDDD